MRAFTNILISVTTNCGTPLQSGVPSFITHNTKYPQPAASLHLVVAAAPNQTGGAAWQTGRSPSPCQPRPPANRPPAALSEAGCRSRTGIYINPKNFYIYLLEFPTAD